MAFLVGEFGNQPNKLQSITWGSGTATLTIPSSGDRAAFKSGDQILIGKTGTLWDGNVLNIATIDSTRRLITANCPQYAENWTGSSGRFLDAGPRLQRTLDALYYADIDVGMMWMYDSDAYKPDFETVADHQFQQQIILNANTRLGW